MNSVRRYFMQSPNKQVMQRIGWSSVYLVVWANVKGPVTVGDTVAAYLTWALG